jgi:hypothetical protein
MQCLGRALPYVLSWAVLAALMIVGMRRVPLALYTPIDGEWAKWNVEAILHFGKPFDLSPYSMLAGMGSMYFPNLPWLNPGALALALPLAEPTRDVVSYAVYAAELAVSIVVLARAVGFSWLIATAAAQLYLYLLFPPFSQVFHVYDWYSLAPYYAHLTAVLNGALAALLACGRSPGWQRNLLLAAAFFILFVSGLLSAPFTFVFATAAYVVIGGVLILARRPSRAEWGWKAATVLACLAFVLGSGLIEYYLGTVATTARTPAGALAWDRLLSPGAWLRRLREHSVCEDPRLLLCLPDRGAWLLIAALTGAAVTIVTRRGAMRAVACALIVYIVLAHVYAFAYQAAWLGAVSVLSPHFLILSSWSFVCLFAVIPFCEPLSSLAATAAAQAKAPAARSLLGLGASVALAGLLAVIVVMMLRHPYAGQRYHALQLIIALAAAGVLVLALEAMQSHRRRHRGSARPAAALEWRRAVVLSVFPILALVHLSMGIREERQSARDPALRNYLRAHAAIEVGRPFRGYAATIWLDKTGELRANPFGASSPYDDRYDFGRDYFRARYGEIFTETDLWRWNIPTLEEYGEWSSRQAHAFAARLLAPAGIKIHSNYLRAFAIDSDILRALGVRYVLTDAGALDQPAELRGSVSAPGALPVRLFELGRVNLGTYSPTRFVRATTADEMVARIRENEAELDRVAVVSDDLPAAHARARDVALIVERDGIRIRAASDGPAYILLPVQYSHCLVAVDGAPIRLYRANLFQTLLSFDGAIDARIEFRFGLFADNGCRRQDGRDNQALGL